MKTILIVITGVLASTVMGGGALAQSTTATASTSEVTVQASRATRTTIGRTPSGIPIQDVSLSFGVSTEGLDLTTASGRQELEKRVSDAAMEACSRLGRQFPQSTPSDSECARSATNKAMAQVQQLEAAAKK
jgi:UrcA family protein